MTSANAVRFGGPGLAALRDLPVHAVGEATAAAAREFGFEIASVGDAGVERLVGALDPRLRLLASRRRGPRRSRPVIDAIAVYRSRLIEAPEELRRRKRRRADPFSPGGTAFALAADRLGLDRAAIRIAAISPAAAEAAGTGWAQSNPQRSRPTTRFWPSPSGCAKRAAGHEREQGHEAA